MQQKRLLSSLETKVSKENRYSYIDTILVSAFFIGNIFINKFRLSQPYYVSILYENPSGSNYFCTFCSGALISWNWVVTSASCYKSRVKVQLGGEDVGTNQMYVLKSFRRF